MPIESIELPAQFLHTSEYRVQAQDINFADHLAAVRVLPIAIQAHASMLESLGHDPETSEFGLIMASSQVDYLTEARLDDTLQIDIAVQIVNDKSFDFVFRIRDTETQSEVARAKTRMLFYDYLMKKVVHTPAYFAQGIETLKHQYAA
jgi:acyl-CoA thioester hydrolase